MKKYILQNSGSLMLWMIFEVSFAGLMVIWSLIISKVLDAGMQGDVAGIGRILIGGIGFFLAMIVSFYLQNLFCARFVSRCTYDLKEDLFHGVMEADANIYTEYNCAKYLSIFNNDVSMVAKDFFTGVPAIFAQLFLALVATVTLLYYNVYLAVFEIFLSIITSGIPILVNRHGAEKQKAYADILGTYNTQIKDYISAGDVLKSYHVEDKIQKVHSEINSQVQKAYVQVEKERGAVYAVITATRYMESALFLVFGSYLIAAGSMSVAVMLGAMQIVGYVANPVKQSTTLYANYERTHLVIENIQKFIREIGRAEQEKEELRHPTPIVIENLSFAYGNRQILKNVSVRFEQGKKYAIIGESGSGKTTLVKIIMQQLNDYDGDFFIGGQDCRSIDRESFVKHFALVQQEVVLFEDTLRNNITMYGEYPEEEVLSAVYDAGLKKYLEHLPYGLDSVIGENGANCSGGERQRITIARALLRKTSVLVMDEATSSLDEATARQIEALVLKNPELTVISVTHHTGEDLQNKYDKVFRMADGVVRM